MPLTMILRALVLSLVFGLTVPSIAQKNSIAVQWNESLSSKEGKIEVVEWFEGAEPSREDHEVPVYFTSIPVDGAVQDFQVELRNPRFVEFQEETSFSNKVFGEEILLSSSLMKSRGFTHVELSFVPIVKKGGVLKKLLSADLQIVPRQEKSTDMKKMSFVQDSKLAQGDWYRIPISNDGVYRLTREYLSSLGVDVNGLDPDAINIYGNDQGLLPFENSEFRHDDLQIKNIEVTGAQDGSFDSGDEIRFYAKGPHRWYYHSAQAEFRHVKHLYSDVAYVFLGLGQDPPQRLTHASLYEGEADVQVTSFDDYSFHERDLENIIKSGRRLVGEKFGLDRELNFSGSSFSFQHVVPGSEATVRLRGVAKTLGSSAFSGIAFSCQGNTESMQLQGVSPSSYRVTRSQEKKLNFPASGNSFSLSTEFSPGAAGAEGWIDFISINVRRELIRTSAQMHFRDRNSVGIGQVAEFRVDAMNSSRRIWEVTDPVLAHEVLFDLESDLAVFKLATDSLREFVVFDSGNLMSPGLGQPVQNQNLHATEQVDMVILTAVPFRSVAEKFASFHREEGISVKVVEPQELYNEFSCGMTDVTAIKMFMKMFYDRADENNPSSYPDYLMIIGDGNYDNTAIQSTSSIYIPTFQSLESDVLTRSYVSDDYFGQLDDVDGEISGGVDIGIGRLPVRNLADAEAIYQKLLTYTSTQTGVLGGQCSDDQVSTFGDWKNRMVVVGDDQDNNQHMSQANFVADQLLEIEPDIISQKILLDAYPQVSTPGGARYPKAQEDLKRAWQEGVFLISYFGHGGEVGWAAERVLDVPTIQGYTNKYALPLLLTATCEFSRFDDPGRTSAGEFTLLNPNGGVISLLTTTRLVFSGDNFNLSKNFYDIVMRKDVQEYSCVSTSLSTTLTHGLRLGDVMRMTKNCTLSDQVNEANFSLLGDPALRLSYTQYDIRIDSLLDKFGQAIDTVKALQRVKVKGHIESGGQIQNGFNGMTEVTILDKPRSVQTLSNDGGNVFQFELQNSIIYKGRASVIDGYFEYEFVVPKDISYEDGDGKIVQYGVSDYTDAQGSYADFFVGGTDTTALADEDGPEIELNLDGEGFVSGGVTSDEPMLNVKVFDESGINTVGNGIGHDITIVLDGDLSNPIVLNQYYEGDLNSFQGGSIQYRLSELSEGKHSLRFKIWDIHNNSSDVEVEFNVEREEELSISQVLNYPNPFTTKTEFLFEHNQSCDMLEAQVQVYTVSGRLVKTLSADIDTHSGVRGQLTWDGRDEYGDLLGRGVYVYRLIVRTPSGMKKEVLEKLVLL